MNLRALASGIKWRLLSRIQQSMSAIAARKHRGSRGLRVMLGCGSHPLPGWINCDYCRNRFSKPDLCFDLRKRFPFADASVRIIHSEHVLEHLEYPADGLHLLRESLRVLEPGGVFSVGVPDPGWLLPSYVNRSDCGYYQWFHEQSGASGPLRTRMEAVNYFFRQAGEHRFIYDEETLAALLAHAGFVDVRRREFNPAMDNEDRRIGTLYMEARKPGNSANA